MLEKNIKIRVRDFWFAFNGKYREGEKKSKILKYNKYLKSLNCKCLFLEEEIDKYLISTFVIRKMFLIVVHKIREDISQLNHEFIQVLRYWNKNPGSHNENIIFYEQFPDMNVKTIRNRTKTLRENSEKENKRLLEKLSNPRKQETLLATIFYNEFKQSFDASYFINKTRLGNPVCMEIIKILERELKHLAPLKRDLSESGLPHIGLLQGLTCSALWEDTINRNINLTPSEKCDLIAEITELKASTVGRTCQISNNKVVRSEAQKVALMLVQKNKKKEI